MIPTTRAEFEQRILNDLGEPVIKVNLAPIQIENAVDDAIAYWSEFHVDAQERTLIKHTITQDDLDNGYIQLPSQIMAVYKVYDPRGYVSSTTWMSAEYELIRDTMQSAAGAFNLSSYAVTKMYLEEISATLAPAPQFDFRYLRGRLHIFDDMKTMWRVGDIAVIDCQGFIYASGSNSIYKDKTLRKLAAAYAKKHWGQNLKKFSGVTLPSGVMLNGDAIYNDALQEIAEMEEYISEQGEPLGIIIS